MRLPLATGILLSLLVVENSAQDFSAFWIDLEGHIIVESYLASNFHLDNIRVQSPAGRLNKEESPAPFDLALLDPGAVGFSHFIKYATLNRSVILSASEPIRLNARYDVSAALADGTDPCDDLLLRIWSQSQTCAIPGDTNFDQQVNFPDFLKLSSNFGKVDAVWPDGDFDWDRKVGLSDFLKLHDNFGTSVRTTQVPEPDSALLFFVIAIASSRHVANRHSVEIHRSARNKTTA